MSQVCAPAEGAPVRERVRHSIRETVWYGPVLLYSATMTTVAVILLATGAHV